MPLNAYPSGQQNWGALSIDFKPRIAIKSQALVDFLAEWWENQVAAPASVLEH
jgi:hypothetical protein